MTNTIPGGAYQTADGAWVNANGEPLDTARQAQAEELHAEQAEQLRQAEAQRAEIELQSDPATRAALKAISAVQAPATPESRGKGK